MIPMSFMMQNHWFVLESWFGGRVPGWLYGGPLGPRLALTPVPLFRLFLLPTNKQQAAKQKLK